MTQRSDLLWDRNYGTCTTIVIRRALIIRWGIVLHLHWSTLPPSRYSTVSHAVCQPYRHKGHSTLSIPRNNFTPPFLYQRYRWKTNKREGKLWIRPAWPQGITPWHGPHQRSVMLENGMSAKDGYGIVSISQGGTHRQAAGVSATENVIPPTCLGNAIVQMLWLPWSR